MPDLAIDSPKDKSSTPPSDNSPGLHNWSFFRAGGVVQIDLKTPKDISQLKHLDRKHWMALAIPTKGVNVDGRTMTLLDTDGDGQVRPPEILQAVGWLEDRLGSLDQLMKPTGSIPLVQLKDPQLLHCAKRVLLDLGQSGADSIQIELVDQAVRNLREAPLNGDGVITPESTHEPEVAALIHRIITSYGSVTDRSTQPGISAEVCNRFFTSVDQRCAWIRSAPLSPYSSPQRSELENIASLNEHFVSFKSVEGAIDSYFTLCQLKVFDKELFSKIMERLPGEAALEEVLAGKPLTLPLPDMTLDFSQPMNPIWVEKIKDFARLHGGSPPFVSSAAPLVPQTYPQGHPQAYPQASSSAEPEGHSIPLPKLTHVQWLALKALYSPYELWLSQAPVNGLDSWTDLECLGLASSNICTKISSIIEQDLQKAADYENVLDLQKLVLLSRDLLKVLQNFVNFSDFYRFRNGMFQTGTLFLDGRSTDLCLELYNPERHTSLDVQSGAFLIYCDCTRASSPKRSILAVMTNGEGSQITAGRAGVFYDRQGLDWTAVITKVIANPVSYREAFFSPYRRIARWVEEQIQKRMSASDLTNPAELAKVAGVIPPPDTKAPAPPAQKFDVGTIAAMGVALGSLGTFLGMIFARFFDLGLLMPFGIAGICLMISLPSVVLAWFKLKNRNLAPILDANGWAINTRAIINVPFAASLTSLRQVPLSFGTVLPDPYAEKSRPWKFYWTMGGLFFVFALWISGYLDRFLPTNARFSQLIHQTAGEEQPNPAK